MLHRRRALRHGRPPKTPRPLVGIFAAAILVSFTFLLLGLHPRWQLVTTVLGDAATWARLLPYYLAGMCFYLLRGRIPYSTLLAIASVALVTAGALLPHALSVALPTAGAYLLFYVAFHPALRLHNWARFGDFSYGIYLYAFPLQQLILLRTGTSISPLTFFLYALPPSLAAGVLSWYLVERWFLRRSSNPKPPAPVPSPEPALLQA